MPVTGQTIDRYLDDLPDDLDPAMLRPIYELVAERTAGLSQGVREPGYRLLHGHRVAKLGRQLYFSERRDDGEPDPDGLLVIWLGGLLHDVVKDGIGQDPPGFDHAAGARDFVLAHLPAHVPAPIVERVARAVYLHNKRLDQGPFTFEDKIVQDADLIDHFGSLEVWLAGYVSAGQGESLEHCLSFLQSEGNRRWRTFALQSAHFDTTRAALRERIETADRIIARLCQENCGLLDVRAL